MSRTGEFLDELKRLINRLSLENGSDTPDYVLAIFLNSAREAFDEAAKNQDAQRPIKLNFLPRIGAALDLALQERTHAKTGVPPGIPPELVKKREL
jgi:hypothetical protein